MDLNTLFSTGRRQWRISLPILAVTLIAAAVAFNTSETSYTADGSMLLVEGGSGSDADAPDPALATDVLVGLLRRPTTTQQLFPEIGRSAVDTGEGGRVITTTLIGGTPEALTAGAQRLIDTAPILLSEALGLTDAGDIQVRALSGVQAADIVQGDLDGDGVVEPILTVGLVVVPTTGAVQNPFAADTGTARVVLDLANRPAVDAAVEQAAPGVGFDLELDEFPLSPIVAVALDGPDPDQISAGYSTLIAAINAELDAAQERAGVAAGARTQAVELEPASSASQSATSGVRAALILLVLGVAAAAIAAVVADRRSSHRDGALHGDDDDAHDDVADGSDGSGLAGRGPRDDGTYVAPTERDRRTESPLEAARSRLERSGRR